MLEPGSIKRYIDIIAVCHINFMKVTTYTLTFVLTFISLLCEVLLHLFKMYFCNWLLKAACLSPQSTFAGKHDVMTKCVQFTKFPIFIPYLNILYLSYYISKPPCTTWYLISSQIIKNQKLFLGCFYFLFL